MECYKKERVENLFNDLGYNETIKYILASREVPYLVAIKDISKIIELAILPKREKSIVKYLNYLEDEKRTIVPSYSINIVNNNDSTNGTEMSSGQIKYMKAIVNPLASEKLAYLMSFVGVLELNTDGHRLERVKPKVIKIKALYTASISQCNIDFKEVVKSLNAAGINSSEQDIIAFISLILKLSYDDGTYVNIPASFWESIFGRRNIAEAKQIFQNHGILTLASDAIPGFKSTRYKITMNLKADKSTILHPIDLVITSINTLEKLNRITRYKGNFTLPEKIEALGLIIDLKLKDIKKTGKTNFTDIFLESAKPGMLLNDLKIMEKVINDNRFYNIALPLGIHLTTYFNNIKEGNFKDYTPYFSNK